jgi:adenylate kinase family enzyme
LIGPIGAGKSTVGKLLSEKLGLPQIETDELRWKYYEEIGYDAALARKKNETEGFWSMYQYWKPFEAHAVERLLADYPAGIIDFGAGHSVYEDDALFARVKKLLAPYPHVILLLPSPNPEESLEILSAREPWLRDMKPNINEHFIRHHSNRHLAKHVVYTKDKMPEQTCEEVHRLVT